MKVKVKKSFFEDGVFFRKNDIVVSSLLHRELMQKIVIRHILNVELISRRGIRVDVREETASNGDKIYEILGVRAKSFDQLPVEYINLKPKLYCYECQGSLIIVQETWTSYISVGDTYSTRRYIQIIDVLKECSKRLKQVNMQKSYCGVKELYI